jgi:hypothetical protein
MGRLCGANSTIGKTIDDASGDVSRVEIQMGD